MRVGTLAPEAASIIHTDFEKGFIRAEVIAYEDFLAHNGEHGTKEAVPVAPRGQDLRDARWRCCPFPVYCVAVSFLRATCRYLCIDGICNQDEQALCTACQPCRVYEGWSFWQ